jgi:hypothetical protein
VTSVLKGFGWNRFGILHGIDNFEEMLRHSVQDSAIAEGLSVVTVGLDSESKTGFNIEKRLKRFQEERVRIIVCAILDRNGVYEDVRRVARELGMDTREYIWIMTDSRRPTDFPSGTFSVEPYVNKTTKEYQRYERAMLGHNHSGLATTTAAAGGSGGGSAITNTNFGTYSPFFYDAVLVLAEAIRAIMMAEEQSAEPGGGRSRGRSALELAAEDAPRLVAHIRRVTALGATGPILFNHSTGDRLGSAYRLVNKHQDGQWVEVGVMRMGQPLPPAPALAPAGGGIRGAAAAGGGGTGGSGSGSGSTGWLFDRFWHAQIQWPGSPVVGGVPPSDAPPHTLPGGVAGDGIGAGMLAAAIAVGGLWVMVSLGWWWRSARQNKAPTMIFISYKHKVGRTASQSSRVFVFCNNEPAHFFHSIQSCVCVV